VPRANAFFIKVLFSKYHQTLKQIAMGRAGLKPMQLHWAPRLWGRRAMVFG